MGKKRKKSSQELFRVKKAIHYRTNKKTARKRR